MHPRTPPRRPALHSPGTPRRAVGCARSDPPCALFLGRAGIAALARAPKTLPGGTPGFPCLGCSFATTSACNRMRARPKAIRGEAQRRALFCRSNGRSSVQHIVRAARHVEVTPTRLHRRDRRGLANREARPMGRYPSVTWQYGPTPRIRPALDSSGVDADFNDVDRRSSNERA
jgi:hypothetical protein